MRDKLEFLVSEELKKWGFSCPFKDTMVEPHYFTKKIVDEWSRDISRILQLVRNCHLPKNSSYNFDYIKKSVEVKRSSFFPVIARPDCILKGESNLKLVELNFDSSLGGLMQLSYFSSLYQELYPKQNELYVSPILGLIYSLQSILKINSVIRILLLVSNRFSSYDILSCHRFIEQLNQHPKIQAKLEWIENIKIDETSIKLNLSKEFDIVYRFDVIKGEESTDNKLLEFVLTCETIGLPVISDTKDLQIEDKGHLALLTKMYYDDKVSIDDRILIGRYILKTVFAEDLVQCNLHENLLTTFEGIRDNKDAFVVKKMYSYGGRDVFVGKYVENKLWFKIITRIYDNPENWVFQEYIESTPITIHSRLGDLTKKHVIEDYILSPFVFGDKIFGFLTRTLCNKDHNGVTGLQRGASMGFFMVSIKDVEK